MEDIGVMSHAPLGHFYVPVPSSLIIEKITSRQHESRKVYVQHHDRLDHDGCFPYVFSTPISSEFQKSNSNFVVLFRMMTRRST